MSMPIENDLHFTAAMEVLWTEKTNHNSLENLSAIQSEGNVDAKPPSSSHEETKDEAKNESPTVHPHGRQTSKSEAQPTGEQVGNSWPYTPTSYRPRNTAMLVESDHWLPKGWVTEVKIRQRGVTAGNTDKYYIDPVTRLRFRSKKGVLHFLKTVELYKGRQVKPAGELRDETTRFLGTTTEFYSSASDIGGISPCSPTGDSLLSSPSCSMPSSTTHSSDLLLHNNHTASLPSYASPMVTVIHQSGAVDNDSIPTATPISGLHDPVALQNTVNPYTIRRQLTGSSDFLVHNDHAASHPLPMVASTPTDTPASYFFDSAASQSTKNSDTLRIQSIGRSNFPFHNKNAAPVPSYRPPMFGFSPQLGAVNNVRIPSAIPISRIHYPAASESAFNPDTIRRPKKFRRILNRVQGSWPPVFTEERVPMFTEEKPTESRMEEGKRMFKRNWQQ